MKTENDILSPVDDAETRFRRRLAAKLADRGVPEEAIPVRIDELLRRGVGLKLDVDHILGRDG